MIDKPEGLGKNRLPTHIDVYADRVGLQKDSVILLEQIRTIDKRRLKEKMGHLEEDVMERVNTAIVISFGLGDSREDAVARAVMQATTPPATATHTDAARADGNPGSAMG